MVDSCNYQRIKDEAHQKYLQIKEVYCPHLNSIVKFNSSGFWHIIYRAKGKKREEHSQILRFKLLDKAMKLLKLTTTTQEYDSFTRELPHKDHHQKILKLVQVEFFGFIAIIDGWKIKVIVKKIGNGLPFFWSVIPNWITNKKRDTTKGFVNFTGDLQED